MSASDTAFSTAAGARAYDEIRKDWHGLNMRPLWENVLAHKVRTGGPPPLAWKWSQVRPLIDDAMKVTSPAAVERRVLTLTDPDATGGPGSTCTNLTAGFQILLPGESARPHRHTMNALRFVIEGRGASTVVDGKDCPMEEGDLVITPGWTWHEHVHKGDAPIIWLDALDAPLHRYLGTDVFEPGPEHDVPPLPDDAAFAVPNVVPEMAGPVPAFSPVFRYPWAAASAAVRAAPVWRDGTRRVRYVNPITGGPAMPLMDCYLSQLDKGVESVRYRTTSSAVCYVCEGSGTTKVGDDTISWEAKDVFSLPRGNWITHRANETATLFLVTDRDALRRLDLLDERFGNEA